MNMKLILREYQEKTIEKIRECFKLGYKALLVALPTGSGKTVIFSSLAEQTAKKNKKILILVHRIELLKQTSSKLDIFGLEHGLISPKYTPNFLLPAQIASVYTLTKRLDKIAKPDLIIVDEAHHATAATWAKILNTFPEAKIIGLTATPCRMDEKGLGKLAGGFFDVLINDYTTSYMIENGYLANYKYYAPPVLFDTESIPKIAGDYEKKELFKRINKPTITGDAITHYKKLGMNMPAIAFCVNVEHAQNVAADFNAAGIASASVDGNLSDNDRMERINDLTSGKIKVLTSCDIISEGTDLPVVGVAILLRMTHSTSLFLQQCGRVLRPYEGKEYAVILDHVGNHVRHGLPDDDREWNLNETYKNKNKSSTQKPYKICNGCYMPIKISSTICPNCGFKPEKENKKIEIQDGELKEVKSSKEKNKRFNDTDSKLLSKLYAKCYKLGLSKKAAYKIFSQIKIKKQ